MKYFIVIFIFLSGACYTQTFAELYSGFEQSRLNTYKHKLSRIEIYSFKNSKDSSLLSYEIFDSIGNIVTARQYNYKNRKHYNEQFYKYDSLGRRITFTSRSTYSDKLNRGKVITLIKYDYKRDSLHKRTIESYIENNLIRIKDFPERKEEKIDYKKKVVDSLDRIVYSEYYSVAGLEKVEIKYHENGQMQSKICHVDNGIWYKSQYNDSGNLIEYYEWIYDNKSRKPIAHSLIYYDNNQMKKRIEYLNFKGKIKSFDKYYYFKH